MVEREREREENPNAERSVLILTQFSALDMPSPSLFHISLQKQQQETLLFYYEDQISKTRCSFWISVVCIVACFCFSSLYPFSWLPLGCFLKMVEILI